MDSRCLWHEHFDDQFPPMSSSTSLDSMKGRPGTFQWSGTKRAVHEWIFPRRFECHKPMLRQSPLYATPTDRDTFLALSIRLLNFLVHRKLVQELDLFLAAARTKCFKKHHPVTPSWNFSTSSSAGLSSCLVTCGPMEHTLILPMTGNEVLRPFRIATTNSS